MSNECEHLQVRTYPNLPAGSCRCQDCGNIMPLSVGFNCLLDAMRKSIGEPKTIKTLPKGESFVSMVIHHSRLYVAATNGVYILESATNIENGQRSEWLRKLPLVTGE